MKKGWLKGMLTPAKQDSEIWQGFVDVLEQMLQKTVEPIIERIDARKSLFSMKGEDLDTRINELGQFFAIRARNDASKPILLSQRIDEIHFKGTDRPITSTFWREFENVPAKWAPLYAPVDQKQFPYGTFFTTEEGVQYATQQYGDFYMTSRGYISLSLNALYATYGIGKQTDLIKRIEKEVNEIVQPLLPLDIVFDGFLLYLDFTLREYAPIITLDNIDTEYFFNGLGKNAGFWEPPVEVTSMVTEFILPQVELTQAKRSLSVPIYYFDQMALDAWPLDAGFRPNIWFNPDESDPAKVFDHDNRIKIAINGFTVDTLGASQLMIEYRNGTQTYVVVPKVNGVSNSTVTVNVPQAQALRIKTIAYSLT
ncbi:hypothetical protein UXN85_20980 [Enterobacter hormaechei]